MLLICRSFAVHARTLTRAGHTYDRSYSLERVREFAQLVRRHGTFEATRYRDFASPRCSEIPFNYRTVVFTPKKRGKEKIKKLEAGERICDKRCDSIRMFIR